MSNIRKEKELLRERKFSLLLTRIAYGSAAFNLGTALSQMQSVNENLSINPSTIDLIAMGLSGLVFIGGLYHANDLKFDIDESKNTIASLEGKER